VLTQRVGQNGIVCFEEIYGVPDLVDLERRVCQQRRVAYAETDDLNRVFAAQSIPHQYEFVDEGEDKEGQEGRDGLVLRVQLGIDELEMRYDAELELGKDISVFRTGQHASFPCPRLPSPCCLSYDTGSTYASKAIHIMAWTAAVAKNSRLHFEERNSNLLLRGEARDAGGMMPSLS
jgi:hypothetical protein